MWNEISKSNILYNEHVEVNICLSFSEYGNIVQKWLSSILSDLLSLI